MDVTVLDAGVNPGGLASTSTVRSLQIEPGIKASDGGYCTNLSKKEESYINAYNEDRYFMMLR